MKPIELTEEQKSKLLEMCNELFPEYPNLKIRDSMEDFCMEQEHCFIELNEVTNREKCTIIHWFEFCMTHLIIKLQSVLPDNIVWREQPPYVGNVYEWKKGRKWTLYTDFFFHYPKQINETHMIDYLYKEFKKLN